MKEAIRIDTLRATLRDADRTFTLDASGLKVAAGEAVALSGASGTGKTCLLEILGLLRRPDAGAAFRLSDGAGAAVEIAPLWAVPGALSRLRGRALGFVPQSGGLLPFLTLAENIRLTQRIAGRPDGRWVDELADRLGIAQVMGLLPDRLSIGQRQRGTIARALAHRPALVVADEPTAALDPEAAEVAMGLIVAAAGEGGSAVLISSHDLSLVRAHTVRGYRLMAEETGPGRVESRLCDEEALAA